MTVTFTNPADSFTLTAALLNCTVASSFAIVTFATAFEMKFTFCALLKVIVNVSFGSIFISELI